MLNTIIIEKIGSMEDKEVIEALKEIKSLKKISFEEAQTLYQIVKPYLLSENSEVKRNTVEAIDCLLVLQPNLEVEVGTKGEKKISVSDNREKILSYNENSNHNSEPNFNESSKTKAINEKMPIQLLIELLPWSEKNVIFFTILALVAAVYFLFFSGFLETNNKNLSTTGQKLDAIKSTETQTNSTVKPYFPPLPPPPSQVSDDYDTLLRKAEFEYQMGNYDDALKYFRSAQRTRFLASHLVRALEVNIGLCLRKLEKWQEAEQSFKRILEDDPGDIQALYNLGLASFNLGKYTTTEEQIKILKKLEYKDSEAVLFRIDLERRLKSSR
ncbi:MAG TPA: tetratricopeptide repeat protein [Methanofastidiosum sp.]|nr:tetratricopeptide repeat protein [Methanofastidiosum sp.]